MNHSELNRSPRVWTFARSKRGIAEALIVASVASAVSLPGVLLSGVLLSGVLLSGCTQPKEGDRAWSTKGQSATSSASVPSGDSEIPSSSRSAEAAAPSPAIPHASQGTSVDPGELRHAAIEVARAASGNASPLLRAHAIEALSAAPDELDHVVGRGLIDSNRGVRFAAAMALAKAKRRELVHLVEPLLNDPSLSVRAAAMAALAACGRQPDLSPLAGMVKSNEPEVRANAYLAIGSIGNVSAVPLVRESIGGGFERIDPARVKIVDLQAAECLVRLGRTDDLEPIRAALFAPVEQSELTALACQMIGRLKDGQSRPMLQRLVEAERESARPPEVRVAALEALSLTSVSGGLDAARYLPAIGAFATARSPGVRAQACAAYAATGTQAALAPLKVLLRDPDPVVQVAAAYAILTLTSGEQAWMAAPPAQSY
jgi:HEAT repeat protein